MLSGYEFIKNKQQQKFNTFDWSKGYTYRQLSYMRALTMEPKFKSVLMNFVMYAKLI